MHEEVDRTRRRSGWPARRTLEALGVSPASYYGWRRTASLRVGEGLCGSPPPQPYQLLPEERQAVRAFALKHPAQRHRELAWRMIDEDVAYLSPYTVYRILKAEELVCAWQRRQKRRRDEEEKAQRTEEVWATDLKYVTVGGRSYYLFSFLDEYSRYIVHHELLRSTDGHSVSTAAEAAIERLARHADGTLQSPPVIRSDNGSAYISREFGSVLDEHGLSHRRITPHCPEENGVMERTHRTIGEALEGEALPDYFAASNAVDQIIRWYNYQRLHNALGYLRPIDYYRGEPSKLKERRRRKLAAARHRRREKNLRLRQPTLPLESPEVVA